MPSQSSGCSNVLECCLHGRTCRAGLQEIEDKEKKELQSEQYVNLADPEKERKSESRKEQVIDRLARQLRRVEHNAERREKRREERRRRRAEKTEGNMKENMREPKDTSSSDISYKQLDVHQQNGQLNGTVNVSLPKTPSKDLPEGISRPKENKNQMANDGDRNVSSKRKIQESGTDNSHERESQNGLARSIYIGVCNFSKAEESVEKRADFRLYHEMVQNPLLDDLEPELPLNLVYKTANGSYRHYPVRTRSAFGSTYFYVETGEKRPIHHCSLNHLVRYYQINAQRHPEHHEYADPFPWWEVSS